MIVVRYILQNIGVKRDTSTRETDCPFDAVAVIQDGEWRFSLRNRDHNHDATLPGAHPTHRKAARTEKVIEQIANHARTGAPSQQTLTHLCLGQDPENPLFKNRDIYKERERLRQQALDGLTPIQALMKELVQQDNWFVRYHPSSGPIQQLFLRGDYPSKF